SAVAARGGGEGRAATIEPPFVGRDDDLQLLKELFHTTVREGKPRLVTLNGVAGRGKSRLLWELEKYLDGVVDSVYLMTGRSPSYGDGVSYWALGEMLRGRAGITATDHPARARARERWPRCCAAGPASPRPMTRRRRGRASGRCSRGSFPTRRSGAGSS